MKNLTLVILSLLATMTFSESSFAAGRSVESAAEKMLQKAPEKINMNTADAQQIAERLSGIGLAKAEAIVAYRKQHGDFKSLEDLALVKGIGLKTIAKNQSKIVFK